MLCGLSQELLEIIVAACTFDDARDLGRCCAATRAAFLALLMHEAAPWPELHVLRDKALRAAQAELDRLLRTAKRDKQLRVYAAVELQRRLCARAQEELTAAQRQLVASSDLAMLAAKRPFVEDDGEGSRPEYSGEATLIYGVRLGYEELKEQLFAGRRWYCSESRFGPSKHASQALTEAPLEGVGYHEFSSIDEVARVDDLLRSSARPDDYQGPAFLDHDLGLDDLLARLGLGTSHRNAQRSDSELRQQAAEASRLAAPSFDTYGRRWLRCFDAHATYHNAALTATANRHGGNLDSLVCVAYTGWGDGPGPEVVLGIPLGSRMDASVFDLEQQYGVCFCEEDEAGDCIEHLSRGYVADLLGCSEGSLKARGAELALRAKMRSVAREIEAGTGVDLAPAMGFHLVTWQGG